ILVIGLGRSGLATAEVLHARGATVYATDEQTPERIREAIAGAQSLGARFVAPDALQQLLPSLEAAVLSPGVPLNGPLVRGVQTANVPVFSEIEVAYRLCKAPIV